MTGNAHNVAGYAAGLSIHSLTISFALAYFFSTIQTILL
jgi:hypothetical protein